MIVEELDRVCKKKNVVPYVSIEMSFFLFPLLRLVRFSWTNDFLLASSFSFTFSSSHPIRQLRLLYLSVLYIFSCFFFVRASVKILFRFFFFQVETDRIFFLSLSHFFFFGYFFGGRKKVQQESQFSPDSFSWSFFQDKNIKYWMKGHKRQQKFMPPFFIFCLHRQGRKGKKCAMKL